jgi:hypothetical protein
MKLLLLKDELDAFITSVKKSIFESHIKYTIEHESKELYWIHFDIHPNDITIFLNEIWRAGVYYSKQTFKTL